MFSYYFYNLCIPIVMPHSLFILFIFGQVASWKTLKEVIDSLCLSLGAVSLFSQENWSFLRFGGCKRPREAACKPVTSFTQEGATKFSIFPLCHVASYTDYPLCGYF